MNEQQMIYKFSVCKDFTESCQYEFIREIMNDHEYDTTAYTNGSLSTRAKF